MTRTQLELGLLVPATEYVRAQRFRSLLRVRVRPVFAAVDVVVAPDRGLGGAGRGPGDRRRRGRRSRPAAPGPTTSPATQRCRPVRSAEDGLPAGLQFAGPWMTDLRLLDVAAAYEEVRS